MKLARLKDSADILGAVLFGSAARGDYDAYSDKDIFLVCRDMEVNELLKVKRECIRRVVGHSGNSCAYRYGDVLLMAERGSLFLWHLKLEGKMIFSKEGIIEHIFGLLKPYGGYRSDLECYEELMVDVKESLRKWGGLSEFDLALLFTIARNCCMLLCCHKGEPRFGRSDVYVYGKRIFGKKLPMPDWVYKNLCSWKLWYERGVEVSGEQRHELSVDRVVECVSKLLEFARGECL